MSEPYELPVGWSWKAISDVTEAVASGDPSRQPDAAFTYVDISSVDNNTLRIADPKRLLGRDAPSRARRPIRSGDVLFSNVRTYLRNIACVDDDMQLPAFASTGFTVLRPSDAIEQAYLFQYVSSDDFIRLVTPQQTGSHYPATSDRVVRRQLVPVPELEVQRRIVARLDDTESARAAIATNLSRARNLLARFRRAILASAACGELTDGFRLGRDLPEWGVERAANVCSKVQSGGTPKTGFTAEPGVPFLKVYNMVDQQVDFGYRPQFVPEAVHRTVLKKSVALPGDVIMNIVGPPLGKVAIVPDDFPEWNLNQAITIFRPSDRVLRDWLYIYLCSGVFMDDPDLVTRGSAGQSNISLTQCRNLLVPVPSIEEQSEIVRRVQGLLATAQEVSRQLVVVEKQVGRISAAGTSLAFRGELAL